MGKQSPITLVSGDEVVVAVKNAFTHTRAAEIASGPGESLRSHPARDRLTV